MKNYIRHALLMNAAAGNPNISLDAQAQYSRLANFSLTVGVLQVASLALLLVALAFLIASVVTA